MGNYQYSTMAAELEHVGVNISTPEGERQLACYIDSKNRCNIYCTLFQVEHSFGT